MSDPDEELFREEMQGVKPITSDRVARANGRTKLDPKLQRARETASEDRSKDDNPLADNFIPEVSPEAILEFARPGVQHGVLKKMRLGKYAVDARLDLHKHTVEQARTAVFQFCKDCLQYDVRTALIVHGKGKSGTIKSCVNWRNASCPMSIGFLHIDMRVSSLTINLTS